MTNVVITGASNGIGRAVAEACAARGDTIVGIDLDGSDLACDVSDPTQVEGATASAFEMLGSVDLVVHAAGVSVSGRAASATPDDARFVVDVNLLGSMYVAQSFGRRLVAQSSPSRIVFVGSEHSLGVPHLYSAMYTATKHAVLGYADVLRRELPGHVRVSVLCPGLVATELWRSEERRPAAYGGPSDVDPASGRLVSQGMPADEVAGRLLNGIEADEFLIVTHAHARRYADERYSMVSGAFERQAPELEDDRYALGRLVPRLAP